ncbi:MAG: hypothetical protein HY886_08320 [Deltaproteobacteria bacterium]|nr:hypothetical protein [Deltaproteobacteria bacterium]
MRICVAVKESHARSLTADAAYREYLIAQASAEGRTGVIAPAAASTQSGVRSFIARMCGSMPLSSQAMILGPAVFAVDDAGEFPIKRDAQPALPSAYKDTQRPLRSGFEMLKAAFNLARGSIDERSGPASCMQPRRPTTTSAAL